MKNPSLGDLKVWLMGLTWPGIGYGMEISKISKLMLKFRKFQEIIFGNFRNFQMSEPFIWEISDFQPNLEIFDGIHAFSNGNFHK